MKILKIFGVVMAIHFFAFVLIFANPGCSSTKKAASAGETAEPAPAEPARAESSPYYSSGGVATRPVASEPSSDAIMFDPDAPATNTPRYTPTRPSMTGAPVAQPQPMPEPEVTPMTVYTVTRNDNLWNIAKKHGVTVPELARANNLRVDVAIQPGQKLIIPGKASAPAEAPAALAGTPARAGNGNAPQPAQSVPPAAEPAAKQPGSMTHVVRPNETLSSIAAKYGVKTSDIAVANTIANPALIRPGMTLIIPGWQAPKKGAETAAVSPQQSAPPTSSPAPAPARSPGTAPAVPSIKVGEPPPPPPSGNIPVIRVEEQPRGF